MIIGASTQAHQSHSLGLRESQSKLAARPGNIFPPGSRENNVSISVHAQSALERETQNIAAARANQEFVDFQGHDGKIRLGLTVLGKAAIDVWSAKGLEITEESILAAAEAFQDAFRRNLDERGSATAGTAISLNRHQIVINSQAVPDWFIEEYKSNLSLMSESKLKSAFENGDTFFVSPQTTFHSEALNRYAEVKHA